VALVAGVVVLTADELGAVVRVAAGVGSDVLSDGAAELEVEPAACLDVFVPPGGTFCVMVAAVPGPLAAPQPATPHIAATSASHLRARRMAVVNLGLDVNF
jgi:hypothetical protein